MVWGQIPVRRLKQRKTAKIAALHIVCASDVVLRYHCICQPAETAIASPFTPLKASR